MHLPDYQGGSLVNLMNSIGGAIGPCVNEYPCLSELQSEELADSRNIVLLVIDGLGYEYLRQYATGSTLHNHLKAKITSVFPSTTATAITTFMTGQAPQQHGLTGWFTYLKELGCVTAVLPFRPRAGGGFDSSKIDVQKLYGHTPLFDLIGWASYVVAPEWIIHSEYNVAHSGSALLQGYNTLSECFSIIGEAVKGSAGNKYIYAYWPDFDRYSHETGCASARVHSHFAELDEKFSGLLQDLAGTDTNLIVTADHGFIDTERARTIHLHDHPLMQESLVLPLCGEPRVAYCYVHPAKERQFVDYVSSELQEVASLKASSEAVTEGFFGAGQAHRHLSDRIGHYILLMKENYIIKDQLAGEADFAHIGVHGGISAQEMFVPLIFARC